LTKRRNTEKGWRSLEEARWLGRKEIEEDMQNRYAEWICKMDMQNGGQKGRDTMQK
jgi:hypothetical protein